MIYTAFFAQIPFAFTTDSCSNIPQCCVKMTAILMQGLGTLNYTLPDDREKGSTQSPF